MDERKIIPFKPRAARVATDLPQEHLFPAYEETAVELKVVIPQASAAPPRNRY